MIHKHSQIERGPDAAVLTHMNSLTEIIGLNGTTTMCMSTLILQKPVYSCLRMNIAQFQGSVMALMSLSHMKQREMVYSISRNDWRYCSFEVHHIYTKVGEIRIRMPLATFVCTP